MNLSFSFEKFMNVHHNTTKDCIVSFDVPAALHLITQIPNNDTSSLPIQMIFVYVIGCLCSLSQHKYGQVEKCRNNKKVSGDIGPDVKDTCSLIEQGL